MRTQKGISAGNTFVIPKSACWRDSLGKRATRRSRRTKRELVRRFVGSHQVPAMTKEEAGCTTWRLTF